MRRIHCCRTFGLGGRLQYRAVCHIVVNEITDGMNERAQAGRADERE